MLKDMKWKFSISFWWKTIWKEILEEDKKALIESNHEQEPAVLKHKTNVVFTDAFSARLWGNQPCKITSASSRYNKHSLAFPFQKNSPFLKVFDNVLNIMQETGSLQNTHRHIAQYKPLMVNRVSKGNDTILY